MSRLERRVLHIDIFLLRCSVSTVVRSPKTLGIGDPGVEHSQITLFGDGESFDVHPLAGHRCVERVGIARLQIA